MFGHKLKKEEFNPLPANLFFIHFHPLKVMGLGSEKQLQVGEKEKKI